ncbi:MAG TPA: sugar ABC transporter substrate-binding protein [Blastocatellia bacterium]|nr:sugar ABC transporter substrate-binding protein [Blastocatellia bacterium]
MKHHLGNSLRRFSPCLLVLAALLSASCNPTKPTAKLRVALVMKSLANEFFQTMQAGAVAHQQAHAAEYELIANGIKDELDVARQVELVEQMIAQRVQAIVIAPADSKALVAACQRAQAAGIVVINIDNKLDQTVLAERNLRIPFIGPDNRKGARLAGEALAKQLKPGDPVAILEGVPTAFNAQQRKAGFEDAMQAAGMNIVSSQSASWETAKAYQITASLLVEKPDLKAILCANDSMALGAVAALKAAGLAGQVRVVGFDNIQAVRQLLKDGQVLATVDQHGDQLAVYGIQYALEILSNQTAPADRETAVDLITAETLPKP